MALPSLDIPTLFIVSAAVVGSSGCVLILARGRDKTSLPQVLWGCAMVIGAAGIVLLTVEPFYDWPARIMGNLAILTGTALSWSGARVFAGRPIDLMRVAAGPVAWLMVYALTWSGGGSAPTVLSFLAGAFYILATAYELWRTRDGHMPSRAAAIALLLVHAAVYLVQAVATAVAPAIYLSDGVIVALMLEALLHTTWMAFLFLALMKERAELQSTEELRILAARDGLTGLWNRRHFDQMLHREFQRAARNRVSLALLMIDIDHFKSFNDTYGHPEGDESLRLVSGAILAACSRPGDQAMRYGGEEFAVLLPLVDETGALAVADMIRRKVERLEIRHSHSESGVVTVSIGAACMSPLPDMQAAQIIRDADQALYVAKSSGRNRVVGSSTVPAAVSLDRVELQE